MATINGAVNGVARLPVATACTNPDPFGDGSRKLVADLKWEHPSFVRAPRSLIWGSNTHESTFLEGEGYENPRIAFSVGKDHRDALFDSVNICAQDLDALNRDAAVCNIDGVASCRKLSGTTTHCDEAPRG